MKNKLQQYFPMIRTEGEVLKELRENKRLWETFCGWEEKYQKEYLDICTGVKGVKLLYDTYFKAIMNPDTRPERLNDFLSEILGKKILIKNSIFRNSLIFQGLPPIKYQNLMYFPLFLPL